MKALICGISGQDGAYLAKLLLNKGYDVIGTSRDASSTNLQNLNKLDIENDVNVLSMATNDFHSVLNTLRKVAPDEIYNLAGQTSVGLSFEQPLETMESIVGGTLNLLESVRFIGKPIKLYNAGSGECFGEATNLPSDEQTAFRPKSPYGVAKASAHMLVSNYRNAYNLHVCTGILFNHESPLRPTKFVTRKIVNAAFEISRGNREKLNLGNLEIKRDWGWAPDYVEAMWKMLQHKEADDFIIATGRTESLEYFVEKVFEYYNLNYKDHVVADHSFLRPSDILTSQANPAKAISVLGWSTNYDIDDVIKEMCINEKG